MSVSKTSFCALCNILNTLIVIAGEDIIGRIGNVDPKKPKSLNFFTKFFELQLLMLQHNAGLTASHPYASSPINWPFLLGGISFWTQSATQKQIYLIGNLVGWWTCFVALSVYVGVMGAIIVAHRRNIHPVAEGKCFVMIVGPVVDCFI